MPPSEIATLMARLQERDRGLQSTALYRGVLDFYNIKRMTGRIGSILVLIDAMRDSLVERQQSG